MRERVCALIYGLREEEGRAGKWVSEAEVMAWRIWHVSGMGVVESGRENKVGGGKV